MKIGRMATMTAMVATGLLVPTATAGAVSGTAGVAFQGAGGSTATVPRAVRRKASITVPGTTEATPAAGSPAIPTWRSAFTFSGKSYPFTMVGTTPTAAGSSTVPTSITPIKFVLASGAYYYPTGAVTEMKDSALFVATKLKTGTTQYGDDVQRASFHSDANSAYHVLLGTPSVKPLITIKVPAADGSVISASDGQEYLAINVNWFTPRVNALAAKAPANSFPMFLAAETYLYSGSNPSSAGIGGFHSAVTNSSGKHTYAYASWVSGDLYGASSANLAAMSHETAEWLNDPYVNNLVPQWSVPSEPQYGCNSYLEVGDPLVGHVLSVGGLNFQDETGFSWFARLKPSIGLGGLYSWNGTFKTYATSC